jgi:hypothetical protein
MSRTVIDLDDDLVADVAKALLRWTSSGRSGTTADEGRYRFPVKQGPGSGPSVYARSLIVEYFSHI